MGRTVAELSATMGSSEFEDWQAYYQVEPWGAWRDNLHAGIVASTLVKLLGGGKRKAPEPRDFIMRPAIERKRAETARNLNWLRTVAKAKK